MVQSLIFLTLLLILGFISKNTSLIAAVLVLYVFAIFASDSKLLSIIQNKGINWGVTVITIAVLAPIASGQIGFKDLYQITQSASAWIALISGLLVAVIAKSGLTLLAAEPEITTALVMGTIIAVAFLKGVAVGPLIGAGIAYMILAIYQWMKGIGGV
ncbi:uncharacterized membrane protein [Bacillus oleivorans]|uniref:UPF0756 membrane protein SAMN05877753_105197 n=1 Tax=Bacillus oleivorans TaxID=1448271 RepID=A0A285CVJ1_9BACI|nr:DUF441 domain-containing protein [Bacillus oleivorans]SNX71435.1 uncharacterized membrane protein [Bacillus oleivorans]